MEKGKDKLIYVHVASLPEDSEGSRSKEIWYLIKQRSNGEDVDGVQLRRVSEDIKPLNYPYSALLDPNCEVVGSCVYVIGGHSRVVDLLLLTINGCIFLVLIAIMTPLGGSLVHAIFITVTSTVVWVLGDMLLIIAANQMTKNEEEEEEEEE
ncbi:hypothetical protein QN277_026452 [Acacia crassicarpa]|uniref:Uncharacterized protein n=1 Tax=Acacia crassicarpa TaxID=499986 RepID=A0AAE1JBD0_9FABA|nr:hypothetical protein QN277_026452 [Acacia crassicarpa]